MPRLDQRGFFVFQRELFAALARGRGTDLRAGPAEGLATMAS